MLKVNAVESLLLDGISDQISLGHCKSVASAQHDLGVLAMLINIGEFCDFLLVLFGLGIFFARKGHYVCEIERGDTFDDQVITCQRSRLIKAANVDFAGVGNSEWLGAENLLLDQSKN